MAWALILTLTQVALACLLSGASNPISAYTGLFCWDGGWYSTIVEQGYYSPPALTPQSVGDVGFFPGYPLFAWAFRQVSGWNTQTSLLVCAQVSAWSFWTYLLLFFARWQASRRLCVLGVVLVLVHPAAFFLVASYSESLFLTGLLGFLYWLTSPRPGARWIAAGHGLVMTATRFVGLPLVIVPLFQAWLERREQRREGRGNGWSPYLASVLVGAIASLGSLLFFAYCWWRFGAWDLYMKTQHVGWNITPTYLGMFKWRILWISRPASDQILIDPCWVSRFAVPGALAAFAFLGVLEWFRSRSRLNAGWRSRMAFYLCAGLLFYIPVSALANHGMDSLVRYVLCVQVMLTLALIHLLTRWQPRSQLAGRVITLLLAEWAVLALLLQLALAFRYMHGLWVA
jgi:hypothetical protein